MNHCRLLFILYCVLESILSILRERPHFSYPQSQQLKHYPQSHSTDEEMKTWKFGQLIHSVIGWKSQTYLSSNQRCVLCSATPCFLQRRKTLCLCHNETLLTRCQQREKYGDLSLGQKRNMIINHQAFQEPLMSTDHQIRTDGLQM